MQQSDINASNYQYYQPPHSHFQNPNPNPSLVLFIINLYLSGKGSDPFEKRGPKAEATKLSGMIDKSLSSNLELIDIRVDEILSGWISFHSHPLNPQSYDPSSYIHNFDPNPLFSDNSYSAPYASNFAPSMPNYDEVMGGGGVYAYDGGNITGSEDSGRLAN
uniref:Uncharacterized protein n=1 Tax=Quercus lobata TaxID=97700 RepID=A0A7N2M1Z0_QUELO